MKKVININFQGRVVPIEETAYDILKQYVESLRSFFANEEGCDEIINDIEGRIAELFAETLKKGSTCITDDNVNAIINSMGRPQDFEDDETKVQSQLGSTGGDQKQQQSSSSNTNESFADEKSRRLFRDENHKVFGGVCAGIANHFGIDRILVRVLFILGFGIAFIPYLILWVAIPSTASTVIGSARKRLFRNPDEKFIAGVCSGLGNYFGINAWIPRVLFLIPFLSLFTSWSHWGILNFPNFLNLSFSPGATLIYIILWLVLPEAKTTSEKLEMKGEKVDLNSIKNTIQQDMQGFGERAQQFGKEMGTKAQEIGVKLGEQGKQFSKEAGAVAGTAVRKTGTTFGDIIALIFKIIAYFILAVVLIAVVGALFGLGIAVTSLLPLKSYFIADGWQSILLWGTFIFFIWVPVIGIITWIVRRIAKIKSNSNLMRYTFVALWFIGLFCFIGLIASISNDFNYHNNPSESTLILTNPETDKLELKYISDNKYYFNNIFLHLEPFASIDEDTAYVRNINIRILKSDNDSFRVTMLKTAYGATKEDAEKRVVNMNFEINQKDSALLFDRGIPVTKTDKFRNQAIYVTVYVPVGKRIQVDGSLGWGSDVHIAFGNDMDYWDWKNDDNGYNWDDNKEYVMTEKGLKLTHPSDDDKTDENNSTDDTKQKLEDIQQQKQDLDKQEQDLKNSLQQDSAKYHYHQPADSNKTPVKPPAKETQLKVQAETSTGMLSSPAAMAQRFTL